MLCELLLVPSPDDKGACWTGCLTPAPTPLASQPPTAMTLPLRPHLSLSGSHITLHDLGSEVRCYFCLKHLSLLLADNKLPEGSD